ncbi:uncharacterized protein LOC129944913 [Eupeodes corollae]|uniref:uncharacterized protein LOC129944913 n=1 Tax=Eupeodes corollae TaxID=290404 RepID=UPI0024914C09|nr:uncharacterized protein LOC129944913 [Eupeodes corollae]
MAYRSQGSSLIIIDSDEIAPSPSVESIEFVESVEELEESVQGPNITILNTVPQEETSLKNNISRFGVQSTIVTKINPEQIIKSNDSIENVFIRLNRHDFAYIASVINAAFPSEAKEEYYSPAINGQKASGKLYDTFANYRNLLSSTGLINRRSKKSSRDLDSTIVNVCDDNCEAFKFIQEYNEPFDEVLENWKRSFAVRWNILEDNKVETADYLAKFPIFILNNSNIFKLFLEDSKMLHPDIALNIDWQICNKVLENGSHLKDPTVKKWITASLNCSEENRKAIGLLVLPYLFPSTKIKARQGKQSFKASKLEIQEKFILYFEGTHVYCIVYDSMRTPILPTIATHHHSSSSTSSTSC